jgi:hypothetical protein
MVETVRLLRAFLRATASTPLPLGPSDAQWG